MADTKSKTNSLKYLITGLVVLAFGLLFYYLLNHGNLFGSGSNQTATNTMNPVTKAGTQETIVPERENLAQLAGLTEDATPEQTQQLQVKLYNELTRLKSEIAQHKAEITQLKQAQSGQMPQTAEGKMQAGVKAGSTMAAQSFEKKLQQLISGGETNKSITFDKVYFDTGSTRLKAESQPQIATLAKQLMTNKQVKILIRGHSDNTGSIRQNSLLSLTRSGNVRRALTQLGVKPERIKIEGVGPLDPIASNKTRKGRKKNRRIELVVIE